MGESDVCLSKIYDQMIFANVDLIHACFLDGNPSLMLLGAHRGPNLPKNATYLINSMNLQTGQTDTAVREIVQTQPGHP
jgi:hypothetical protein